MRSTNRTRAIEPLIIGLLVIIVSLAPCLVAPPGQEDRPLTAEPLSGGVLGPPLRYDPTYRPMRVPPPQGVELGVQSVTINVVYNPGSCSGSVLSWPGAAQAAFDYAVNIWGSLLTSTQPIVVHACWRSDLGSNVLGSAGPNDIVISGFHFSGGISGRAYPVALANAIADTDVNGGAHEINANLSSTFTWYYGLDGNTPPGQADFVTVVLHELGHGLGFSGSMEVSPGGSGSWGFGVGIPDIYDHFAEDGSNISLLNTGVYPNPSTALATALTGGAGGVFFDGPEANLANGAARVPLYAPGTWNPGSSYAHLDTNTFAGGPHALMVHVLNSGAAIHDPGAVALGLFQDMGWSVNQGSELSLAKLAQTTVVVGQTLTYTLVAQNTGAETRTNIVVTDTVPLNSNLDANSLAGDAGFTGTTAGSLITWTTGQSLAPDETLTRTFVVTLNTGLTNGSAITNTGYVSAANIAAVNSSNTVASTVAAPLLSATLSSDPNPIPATAGSITYTLQIQNTGDAAATGVVITNAIPISTSYVPGSASDGGVETSPAVLVWPPTSIDPGSAASRTFRVTVTGAITDGDQLVHIVSATSLEGQQLQSQGLGQVVGVTSIYLPLQFKNN